MFPFLPVAVVGDDSLLANHSELVIALLLSFLADSLHFQERVVCLVYYPTVFYILGIAGVVVKMFDVFLFLLMLLVDSQLHFPVFPFHLVYVLEWFVCLDKPLLFFVPLLYIDVLVLFRKFVDLLLALSLFFYIMCLVFYLNFFLLHKLSLNQLNLH